MVYFQKGDNQFISNKFNTICNFINNTNDLMIRYIKVYFILSKNIFLKCLLIIENI